MGHLDRKSESVASKTQSESPQSLFPGIIGCKTTLFSLSVVYFTKLEMKTLRDRIYT